MAVHRHPPPLWPSATGHLVVPSSRGLSIAAPFRRPLRALLSRVLAAPQPLPLVDHPPIIMDITGRHQRRTKAPFRVQSKAPLNLPNTQRVALAPFDLSVRLLRPLSSILVGRWSEGRRWRSRWCEGSTLVVTAATSALFKPAGTWRLCASKRAP